MIVDSICTETDLKSLSLLRLYLQYVFIILLRAVWSKYHTACPSCYTTELVSLCLCSMLSYTNSIVNKVYGVQTYKYIYRKKCMLALKKHCWYMYIEKSGSRYSFHLAHNGTTTPPNSHHSALTH